MLRFIASSARELKTDSNMTPLRAFDTLQRVHKKYKEKWISVWIVCADGYRAVTPGMPVGTAIGRIDAHGGAVGIVGVCVIARQFTFLKKPLLRGKKALEILDRSGNEAADLLLEVLEPTAIEKRLLREQEKSAN